jgi:hypothetical protein
MTRGSRPSCRPCSWRSVSRPCPRQSRCCSTRRQRRTPTRLRWRRSGSTTTASGGSLVLPSGCLARECAALLLERNQLRLNLALLHQGHPTEAEWNERRMKVHTSALASSGGLGCIRVLWAAALSFSVPRVSVCPGPGVDLVDGGMYSLARHLYGRDRARRVMLEAQPRDPRPAPVRRLDMIAAIYARKSTDQG